MKMIGARYGRHLDTLNSGTMGSIVKDVMNSGEEQQAAGCRAD